MQEEPITTPSNNRLVIFPINYDDIWAMYKKQVDCFWRPEEIELAKDLKDWDSLTNNERHFISLILGFFASSDGIIMENLATRFLNEVQISEARSFYSFQIAMEAIHGETYSLLIDTLIKDGDERDKLFKSIETFPCIKKKADWALKWIRDDNSFATRLIAFACVEGIFFSGAFCSIFWLKKRGLMDGLCFSNELISRDEALHCEFAVLLYKKLNYKVSASIVRRIVKDCVSIEIEFITEALPCRLIGMNAQLMTEYIQFVADRLLLQLGYDRLYNVSNPFAFMELISLESKSNFFEKKVSEYALADKTKSDDIFEMDSEF